MKRIFVACFFALGSATAFTQNVGINSTGAAPNSSAGLDVDFTSKGVLIPRVSLTQTSLASPITSPATSLIVYNTVTVNDVTPGYYYWDGTKWVRIINNGNSSGGDWSLAGNSISGSEFIGTTSNSAWVVKSNNLERMRVLANGTVKMTGTSVTSPGIWMEATTSAAAGTAYGILSRGTLTAVANGDGFIPFSTNLGVANTGTALTGLYYYGGHFDANSWSKTGTGTIDNAYGIYVTTPTIGTNNYGGAFLGRGNQLKLILSSESAAALTTIDFGLATPTDPEGSLSVAASAAQFAEFSVAQDVVLRARKNNLILCTRNVSSPTTGDILFGTGMPCTEKMRIMNGGNVGIGTSTPSVNMEVSASDVQTTLNIINTSSTSAHNPRLNIYNYGAQVGGGPVMEFHNARGTSAAPTTISSGDVLGTIDYDGYDGTAFFDGVKMYSGAAENWTAAAHGSFYMIATTLNGTAPAQPVERFRITDAGNVGIGTGIPTALLSVNGAANNTTGVWAIFSDSRIKTIDSIFTDGLDVIMNMRPVKFHYNSNAPFHSEKAQIGIVAQELEKIAPYMVDKIEYQGIKDLREVNGQAYTFLLINSIKEQQQMIEQQKQVNSKQQKEIDELKAMVSLLSEQNLATARKDK